RGRGGTSFSGNGTAQFDTEMAAPLKKDSNWHRSRSLQKECEWKQGESAGEEKALLTESAFSWKPRPSGSGLLCFSATSKSPTRLKPALHQLRALPGCRPWPGR